MGYIPNFDTISSSTTYPRAASLSVQKKIFLKDVAIWRIFLLNDLLNELPLIAYIEYRNIKKKKTLEFRIGVGMNFFEISYVKKENVPLGPKLKLSWVCLVGCLSLAEERFFCLLCRWKYKISICILWNCRVCANCSVETGDTLATNFNILAWEAEF